jgi:anti-anti-sigma regulatory factor
MTDMTGSLSGTRFLETFGISVLLKGHHEADRSGVGYRIGGATAMVRQILSLTGVLQYLSGEPQPGAAP